MTRTYSQYCPVAHALDLVGERWSLLVVRELQDGPLRYTDLLERLESCSTNVLAARLRGLEAAGVVRRERLAPPAASAVYVLTEEGEGLRDVLAALAHWGARTLGPPPSDGALRPGWLGRAFRTVLAGRVGHESLRMAVRSGEEAVTVGADGVRDGADPAADATLSGDGTAVYHLLVDGDPGALEVEGDPAAVEALLAALRPAAGLERVPG